MRTSLLFLRQRPSKWLSRSLLRSLLWSLVSVHDLRLLRDLWLLIRGFLSPDLLRMSFTFQRERKFGSRTYSSGFVVDMVSLIDPVPNPGNVNHHFFRRPWVRSTMLHQKPHYLNFNRSIQKQHHRRVRLTQFSMPVLNCLAVTLPASL